MYNTLSTTFNRYIFAAVLARSATGAAIVAVVLLARDNGADGAFSGALAACLTLPHLLGPLYGRWLEHAANPCWLIGSAALLFVACFQAAIASFGADLPILVTVLLLLCGTCGSFIMGGLSTQLIPLIGADHFARRRAQSWDTATYAVGTTCGPLLLAVLTSAYSIQVATGVVMALPLISGIVIFSLGKSVHHTHSTSHTRAGMQQILHTFRNSSPLKRTILMTSAASFAVAALPVMAVYLGESWQHNTASGAYLVTAYGMGNLVGAFILIIRPLTKEPLILLRNFGGLLLVSIVAVALSYSLHSGLFGYLLVGVVNAMFFAGSLAARSEYAPERGTTQIYMWVAAAKIGAASMGAMTAGYLVDVALFIPFITSLLVLTLAVSVPANTP